MRMRAIGSICTATVRGMDSPGRQGKAVSRFPAYTRTARGGEGAAGATKTASPRRVRPAAQGLRDSQTRAARAIRRRLVALIAAAAASRSARALTSTKAIEPPRLRDEIDLAARDGIAPVEDRIALEAQQQGGDRLGLEAEAMRAAPAASSARAGSGALIARLRPARARAHRPAGAAGRVWRRPPPRRP